MATTEPLKSTNVRSIPWQMRAFRLGLRGLGAVAPSAAARIGLARFLTPRTFARPPRERGWLQDARRSTLDFQGGELALWTWGDGPPVLLVHGWEGRGSQLGAIARELAQAGFAAHALDAPAHGASTGDRSSLPQFGDAVFRAALELGPLAGIVAHSFGVAASAWALSQGAHASRLTFVSPPGDLNGSVRGFCDLMGLSGKAQERFFRLLERRFDIVWDEASRIVLDAARPAPLLVVTDEEDEETPLSGARTVAAAWSQSRLEVTSGLGHRRILRNTQVVQEISRFFTEQPAVATTPYTAVEA